MSIKKYLLGIFILGLGFINFSFAQFGRNTRQTFDVGLEEGINDGTDNYVEFGDDYSIKFNGQYKFLFVKHGDAYGDNFYSVFFWTIDGRFGSVAGNIPENFQGGYFNQVYVRNGDIDTNNMISNGRWYDYDDYKLIMKEKTVDNVVLGRTSTALGLCFHTTDGFGFCFDAPPYNIPSYQESFTNTPFVDNYEAFNLYYGSLVGDSPFAVSSGGGETIDLTNITCPTIGQIIKAQFNGYSKYLCYGGFEINDIMNEGDSIRNYKAGSGANIFELYEQTKTGFNNIQERYTTYYTFYTEGQTTAFYGIPKSIAGLMSARKVRQQGYTQRNITTNNIITYCDMLINYDQNQTTCTLTNTGNQYTTPKENITINDIEDLLQNTDRTVINPNTGATTGGESVFNILQTEEQEKKRDVVKSVQSIYYKITGLFYKRNGIDGIIPEEITRIIILILLFKLFKK